MRNQVNYNLGTTENIEERIKKKKKYKTDRVKDIQKNAESYLRY